MSKIFAGNWKMNPSSLDEAISLFDSYLPLQSDLPIWLFPPALYLQPLLEALRNSSNTNIRLGAQSISDNQKGAFTGQVSSEMIKNLGIDLTLVGHSEARKHQVNAIIGEKYRLAFENNITPIVCLGYQHQDESFEQHNARVAEQVQEVLSTIKSHTLSPAEIIFAYEPIWAIGTGKVADEKSISEVIDLILDQCKDTQANIKILYGGSVDEQNIHELINIPNLDGFLVGGTALKKEKFTPMIQAINL